MMDKQQEQTKQNPNQEVEYISAFLDEDEEVNESDFDEPTEEQEKGSKLADNRQNKPEGEGHSKKPKRPRKTIEQEIAELDAKRERLMEKKRRQDAHEKIVFGAICINIFRDFCRKEKNQKEWENWKNNFKKLVNIKDNSILENIIKKIEKDI